MLGIEKVTVEDLINMLKKCDPKDEIKIHQYSSGRDEAVNHIEIEKTISKDDENICVVIY